MDINKFGRTSFVTWTAEDLRKEREAEMDKEFICLSCSETYADGESYCCTNCSELLCPKCGGQIQTIKEYDEAMLINARKS